MCPRAARRTPPRAASVIAALLSRWRCVCPCSSVGHLLHDDFLAGADQPGAFVADPFERCLKLLFCLDTAAKVAAKAERGDALPVYGAAQLGDGSAKTGVTGVSVRAELRDRQPLHVLRPASFERRGEPLLLVLIDVGPTWSLDQLIKSLGVRRHSRLQRLVV